MSCPIKIIKKRSEEKWCIVRLSVALNGQPGNWLETDNHFVHAINDFSIQPFSCFDINVVFEKWKHRQPFQFGIMRNANSECVRFRCPEAENQHFSFSPANGQTMQIMYGFTAKSTPEM